MSNAEYLRQWRKKNPEKHRLLNIKHSKIAQIRRPAYKSGWQLKKLYGIGYDQKQSMVDAQQGKCAICGNIFRNSQDCHLDHNHTNNKIRGILCGLCNKGLGQFKDNKLILEQAINYLNRYEMT